MFDDFTDEMLLELAVHLTPSSEPYQRNSEGNCVNIVEALQSCLQQVVTEMSQCSDVWQRKDWNTVYTGLETMSSVVTRLSRTLNQNTQDL